MPQATRAAALELETRQQRAIKTGAACNIIESNLRQEVPSSISRSLPIPPAEAERRHKHYHWLPLPAPHTLTPGEGERAHVLFVIAVGASPRLLLPLPPLKVNACLVARCERKSLSSAAVDVAAASVDQLQHLKHIIILARGTA